jgi:hypothetical protein
MGWIYLPKDKVQWRVIKIRNGSSDTTKDLVTLADEINSQGLCSTNLICLVGLIAVSM